MYLIFGREGRDKPKSEPAAARPGELGVYTVGGGDVYHPAQGGVGHAQSNQQTLVDINQVLEQRNGDNHHNNKKRSTYYYKINLCCK